MDGLVEDGFILLGGPLEGGRDTLHIVEADSEDSIRGRLAEDPWAQNGMLRPISVSQVPLQLVGGEFYKGLRLAGSQVPGHLRDSVRRRLEMRRQRRGY